MSIHFKITFKRAFTCWDCGRRFKEGDSVYPAIGIGDEREEFFYCGKCCPDKIKEGWDPYMYVEKL